MAVEDVTSWLAERKPTADIVYEGENEDGLHVWDLAFPDSDYEFRIGMADEVVEDEALLSERLMELESQGWLDQAGGDKDIWVLVAPAEVARGPSNFR